MATVTVLIPAHNETDTIEWCVRSVQEQDYPVERIIVVADACTDNTAELARTLGVEVVETEYKDKAQAQNAVLFDITSDLIVGFDGDTAPAPGCIRLMVEHLEENGLDATCSTILPAQGDVFPYTRKDLWGKAQAVFFTSSRRFAYALGRKWWRFCQSEVGRVQVLTGACYTFRTEAIQSIGGFPNGLITSDMDATWTLYEHGYTCGYAGKALSLTMDPEDFSTYRNQMRRWSSGYFQNMKKHRGQLKNWRSALVVGSSILDMVMLAVFEVFLVLALIFGWPHSAHILALMGLWTGVHLGISITLVSSVIGIRKALVGAIPYLLINYYNKYLYICAMFREWVLDRNYAAWTGRQGRKTVITPIRKKRLRGLTLLGLSGGVIAWDVWMCTNQNGVPGWIALLLAGATAALWFLPREA